jgi:hypothetical protein
MSSNNAVMAHIMAIAIGASPANIFGFLLLLVRRTALKKSKTEIWYEG